MTDDRARPDHDARWEGLARYLAGESDPDEQQRIRDALARDAERAALVHALDAALAPPVESPLSPREVEAALASVMARRDPRNGEPDTPGVIPLQPRPSGQLVRLRSRWRRAGLRAAAAVVVVAGASMLWRATRVDERGATTAQVTTAAEYRTAAGEIDTLRLSDGSTVVLGPSSTLSLAGAFGTGTREATLDGQAFFDVVHDDARPFVVRTSGATLRDVGTSFDVRSDSRRGTRVAVVSGAVDVTADRPNAGSPTVLHAGDRAEVTEDGMRVQRGGVTQDELSWTRGVLEFRDAPLAVVAGELQRWYGVKLVVTDSTIAARRLTATFQGSNADELGRVLAAVLGGTVTRTGDTLRLGARVSR
jgi:transmembrane sensor